MHDNGMLVNQVANQLMIAEDQIGEYVRIAKTLRTAMDPSEVVAEANQVYPHIWDALESARAGLVDLGCDPSRFDTLRAAVDSEASGGEIDADEARWDLTESLMRLGLVKTQQVSFSLNVQGVALADEARKELEGIAPPAVNAALARQQEQVEALGLNKKRSRVSQRLIYSLFCGAILLVALWVVWR
jgi:hypothetical protein